MDILELLGQVGGHLVSGTLGDEFERDKRWGPRAMEGIPEGYHPGQRKPGSGSSPFRAALSDKVKDSAGGSSPDATSSAMDFGLNNREPSLGDMSEQGLAGIDRGLLGGIGESYRARQGSGLSDSAGEYSPPPDYTMGEGSILGAMEGAEGTDLRRSLVNEAKNSLHTLNANRQFLGDIPGYHKGVRALAEMIASQGYDPYDILGEASEGSFRREMGQTPVTNSSLYGPRR